MDPTTFTPDQAVLVGPGVAYAADSVTAVAGSNNTRFTVAFTATATGQYTLVIGPNIYDPFGNAMDQNGNLIPGEVPGDQYTIPFNILGPRINTSQTLALGQRSLCDVEFAMGLRAAAVASSSTT